MATAHTEAIIRRTNARELAHAITVMADRYARSDRNSVSAYSDQLRYIIAGKTEQATAKLAEQQRYERAAMRQRAAVARLARALANMATN